MPYEFQTVAVPGADLGTWLGGINNAGQVTGYSMSTSVPVPQAFVDTSGSFTQITGLFHPRPADISNAGVVVGSDGDAKVGVNAFLWNPDGSSQEILTHSTGGGSPNHEAFGINDVGQVVGSIGNAGFVWQNGTASPFNVPGANITQARGINNAGVIVGTADNRGMVDIGGQFSFVEVPGATATDPMAINNADVIVGSYNDGAHWHGFIDNGGQLSFINAPGASDTWISGINDIGTISGYASSGGGVPQGFIATDPPADPAETTVREDYIAGFARDADQGGLNWWSGLVRAGMTPAQLANDLAGSAEFQADHGQQSNADYVDSIYVNALGRHAEPSGQAAWAGALQAGASRGDVMAAIAQSPEGQQHFAAAHG